jgi:transposase
MKKLTTQTMTFGLDLGDRKSEICAIDSAGKVVERVSVSTTKEALADYFNGHTKGLVVLEVGTHSPWISRLLEELGNEVLIANPRRLAVLYGSRRKNDKNDAELLARLGRADSKLLSPIRHRDKSCQEIRALLKARELLVKQRTAMINGCRSLVKSMGGRINKCSAESFAKKAPLQIPAELARAVEPLLLLVENLTAEIKKYDREVERIAKEKLPEAALLQQIPGVGPLTAVGFIATIGAPNRFSKSRDVGPYLGLVPKQDESGETSKQLPITKTGDAYMRRLLVSAAHYIIGPFGPDTDLRRAGLRISERGAKNAKKRAVVAVARKLAVLMHRLWVTGEEYEPLRNATRSLSTLENLQQGIKIESSQIAI